MKRISTYLLSLLLFSCNNNVTFEPHNSTKKVIYPSDNPAERVIWEQIRFRNPETGKIPSDMRRKEMTFAKTIPASDKISKSMEKPFNL